MISPMQVARTSAAVLIALAVSATLVCGAQAQSTLDIRSDNALRRTETDSPSQARKAVKEEDKKKQEKRVPAAGIKQPSKALPTE